MAGTTFERLRKEQCEVIERKTFEIIKETVDMFMKFEPLIIGKADEFPGNVPLKSNKGGDEEKMIITLLIMPRDTQGGNAP